MKAYTRSILAKCSGIVRFEFVDPKDGAFAVRMGASLGWFLMKSAQAKHWPRQSPLWNRSASSDHLPTDGLWLVEPHFASEDLGAKWEEILVIEKGRARWLEDEPPHVLQWGA
jgi:hypothetical protein